VLDSGFVSDLEFEPLPPLGVFSREELDREFVESFKGHQGTRWDSDAARERRAILVRLVDGGWTYRELAELAATSKQAIQQGVKSNRPNGKDPG
jgi:hypothetical protein